MDKKGYYHGRKIKRNNDGTFKFWGKKDDKGLGGSYHGMKVHIGKQHKKQTGKVAQNGEIHRTKNIDGTYNKNAVSWVKTPDGWKHLNQKWSDIYNIDLRGKKLKGR